MNQNNWKRVVAGGAVGLALMAGTVWAVNPVVYAQDDDTAETEMPTDETTEFGRGFGQRGMMGGNELLLNALGVTRAEYQEAYQAAWESAVADAVANGDLTQEEADALLAGEGRGYRSAVEVTDANLAEALGITEAELTAAREGAVDQAVEDGLLTEAQANEIRFQELVQQALQDAYEVAVQQGVDQGLISQAQADQMLSGNGMNFGRSGFGGRGFGGRGIEGKGFDGMERGRSGGRGNFNGRYDMPGTGTLPTPDMDSDSSPDSGLDSGTDAEETLFQTSL